MEYGSSTKAQTVYALSLIHIFGHNQLGSINKASVQFIASALGILLALIVSTVDYRALALSLIHI